MKIAGQTVLVPRGKHALESSRGLVETIAGNSLSFSFCGARRWGDPGSSNKVSGDAAEPGDSDYTLLRAIALIGL